MDLSESSGARTLVGLRKSIPSSPSSCRRFNTFVQEDVLKALLENDPNLVDIVGKFVNDECARFSVITNIFTASALLGILSLFMTIERPFEQSMIEVEKTIASHKLGSLYSFFSSERVADIMHQYHVADEYTFDPLFQFFIYKNEGFLPSDDSEGGSDSDEDISRSKHEKKRQRYCIDESDSDSDEDAPASELIIIK